jgi:hypothetical protein
MSTHILRAVIVGRPSLCASPPHMLTRTAVASALSPARHMA